MSSSIKLTNAKNWLLIVIFSPMLSVSFMTFIFDAGQQMAFAQGTPGQQEQGAPGGSSPEDVVVRRVEIWGVFYRLMIIAFAVGAVVQGTIIYVCWRFRESNKKNKPRESLEGMHR
jgi:hypothetical protein